MLDNLERDAVSLRANLAAMAVRHLRDVVALLSFFDLVRLLSIAVANCSSMTFCPHANPMCRYSSVMSRHPRPLPVFRARTSFNRSVLYGPKPLAYL